MRLRTVRARTLIITAVAVATLALVFLAGWWSADAGGARPGTYQRGHDAGYFEGLRAGEAQGREEGRALQAGSTAPSGSAQAVQQAFTNGYAAGANDVFGGVDGGWATGVPYVVVIEPGSPSVTYRIDTRTLLLPGTSYYVCADGHSLCQRPLK